MLRATTACTFSTSQLPKVVREWCVLYILTSKEKHSVSRLSYLFAHLHLLSSDSFSSDLLSSNLSLVSASALLCFSPVHIVGSLTSKLPSNRVIQTYSAWTACQGEHTGKPMQGPCWLPSGALNEDRIGQRLSVLLQRTVRSSKCTSRHVTTAYHSSTPPNGTMNKIHQDPTLLQLCSV